MEASTPRIEEYLETIYKMAEMDDKATVTKIAEQLGVSAASVSEMVRKLEQGSLVAVGDHKAIMLTPDGELRASQVVRKHRLAEVLLTDVLGYDWLEVHDEACNLEHAISEEMADKMARSLKGPDRCPHGHPIPDSVGKVTQESTRSLADGVAGASSRVVSIPEENREILGYLASLGLTPGTVVEIDQVAPQGGPLTVVVAGKRQALARDLAVKIRVAAG